ncbi:sugar phosphate isomerase [Weissella muntiaci]|uniref:Sugar phosphate isomerase n=1 Tax=Weissella muntiaci TaxID=2508881 RepID=A0A6C2C5Q6_9LACO|nr:sugar phosphate isomerase [Weissella muntiaci]TYC49082.1 sugar phosphate isomerase [Weissella muntiaci]
MAERQLIINTLVFENDVVAGAKQQDLLAKISKLGIKAVEARREFFKDFSVELENLAEAARELEMQVYLSIPDVLFDENGALNPKFNQYVAEAERIDAVAMKMNIGSFEKATDAEFAALKLAMSKRVQLNVENDQSKLNGTMAPIKKFLSLTKTKGLAINFVFDVANWRFVDEDELAAAKLLSEATTVIHLKNAVLTESGHMVVPFDQGNIDWKTVLRSFSNELPVALEYPVESDQALLKDVVNLKAELGLEGG